VLPDSSLGAIPLPAVAPVLCASRAYLDRAPPLRHPRDLADHVTICFGSARKVTWRFVRGDDTCAIELAHRACANSAPMIGQLAAAGAGIAMVPPLTATTAGLETLEPGGFRPRSIPMHLVTPSSRSMPPKLRAFAAMLRAFVARRADLFRQA
jgi:DNA-binding transcriptional LysR family regulator